MKTGLVSVIIPVYNSERTIIDCLLSVINQTYSNTEIIIVNDGSSDNSLEKIEEFSKVHSMVPIRLISQENQGVAVARNTGIRYSNGEFIVFLDSDDQYKPYFIELMMREAIKNNNTVLVTVDFDLNNTGRYLSDLPNRKKEPVCISLKTLAENYWYYYEMGIINSPCNKLFSKSLIENNNLRFPEGIKIGEDLLFNLLYFECIQSILYIPVQSYIYNLHENQATSRIQENIRNDMVTFLLAIKKFLTVNSDFSHEIENNFNHQVLRHLMTAFNMGTLSGLSPNIVKNYLNETSAYFNDYFELDKLVAKTFHEKVILYLSRKGYHGQLYNYLLLEKNLKNILRRLRTNERFS